MTETTVTTITCTACGAETPDVHACPWCGDPTCLACAVVGARGHGEGVCCELSGSWWELYTRARDWVDAVRAEDGFTVPVDDVCTTSFAVWYADRGARRYVDPIIAFDVWYG